MTHHSGSISDAVISEVVTGVWLTSSVAACTCRHMSVHLDSGCVPGCAKVSTCTGQLKLYSAEAGLVCLQELLRWLQLGCRCPRRFWIKCAEVLPVRFCWRSPGSVTNQAGHRCKIFSDPDACKHLCRRLRQTQLRFVDVGAFHPIHLSNTYFFERCLGWRSLTPKKPPPPHLP